MSNSINNASSEWLTLCDAQEILPNLGVRALVNGEQVAIYKVNNVLYAINAMDPFSQAAVLSRGLVGDLKGQIVVASPIYKQHFNLETGRCLEDETVCVKTYTLREHEGKIQVQL